MSLETAPGLLPTLLRATAEPARGPFVVPMLSLCFPQQPQAHMLETCIQGMWDSLLQLPHYIPSPVLTLMHGTQWAFTLLFNSLGGLQH